MTMGKHKTSSGPRATKKVQMQAKPSKKRKHTEESTHTSRGISQPPKRNKRSNAEISHTSPNPVSDTPVDELQGEASNGGGQESGQSNGLSLNSSSLPVITQELAKSFELRLASVISSSPIQKKVKAALQFLKTLVPGNETRQHVFVLHSKAVSASKLISIVEIAKRELGKGNGAWYQYSVIGELVTQRTDQMGSGGKHQEAREQEDEEDEDKADKEGFETMLTPFERAIKGKPKIRAAPTLTIYLSKTRVDKLRNLYSEQTNQVDA